MRCLGGLSQRDAIAPRGLGLVERPIGAQHQRFERLTGARSLDKAIEVQRDFAKQAYATFVAETQKIGELHGELAKQTLKPLERLVAKASKAGR